ncbi:hypothetical protein TNCV_1187241 [Trichonephila clavipes]|nr:hypothetical protein TNCV_1187241 [Trichonephila clavipes]
MIVGSKGTTNHNRAWGRKPRLVGEYRDSSSLREDDKPDEVSARTNVGIGALQRVPSHVGIPGNENADQKAQQGTESSQPEVPLTLRRAKSITSTFIDKYTTVTRKTLKSHEKL